jgi:hypothetical protein
VSARPHQLLRLDVGDAPDAWRAAGFAVDDAGVVLLGRTEVHCTGRGGGALAWHLDGVDADVDGLPTAPPPVRAPVGEDAPRPDGATHPNGVGRIDHVVVTTGDGDRTAAALGAAGLEVRGRRDARVAGRAAVQSFLWAGDVIVEVVAPAGGPTGVSAAIWGLALVAEDLDATAAALGPLLGAPRDAVQPGRRIASLRGRDVGIAVPLAVMSPHPG